MKLEGHTGLGHYLIKRYLSHVSPMERSAFLLGCQWPDRNPTTYLKGSIKYTWFRGHNFENAQKFMTTLCSRLDRKILSGFYDYYSLGKLIHYIADSFTYCHNSLFNGTLTEHRAYEVKLQKLFPEYLHDHLSPALIYDDSPIDTILSHHSDYLRMPQNPDTDSEYTVRVSCAIMELLLSKSKTNA